MTSAFRPQVIQQVSNFELRVVLPSIESECDILRNHKIFTMSCKREIKKTTDRSIGATETCKKSICV